MGEEDKSLDVVGVGKLPKAIPARSWNQIVRAACETSTQLISPITAITGGLGRLIGSIFDGMVAAQRIRAADAVERAEDKVEKSRKGQKGNPKAIMVVQVIENASNESDENIRKLVENHIAGKIV